MDLILFGFLNRLFSFVIIFRNISVGLGGISIMFRSPSRNARSKGFKVKHVLQICLLLAVCFWLIYQVKHSHDKNKEFDANDVKVSSNTQAGNEVVKFGRKDLHPRIDEPKSEKHGEEENEEEEEAGGAEEEESKHDEEPEEEEETKHFEEQEEEESKVDERVDEGRGDGDDEIDENDQDRAEGESDHEEETLDEEKEREEEGDEKESGEKESEEKEVSENEKEMDDQDHDDGSRNAHEAREEQYKADDASSAVAHDTQTNGGETDKMEDFDENTLEQETEPNDYESNVNDKHSKAEEVTLASTEASSNVTDSQKKGTEINIPESESSLHLNTPITIESIVQTDVSNNNSSEVNKHESSEGGIKPSDSDTKNENETVSEPVQAQNVTGEGIVTEQRSDTGEGVNTEQGPDTDVGVNIEQGADTQDVLLKQTINNTTAMEDNQSGSELENAGTTAGESSNFTSSYTASEAEHNPESLISKENSEKPDTSSGSGEADESSASSSKDESGDPIQQDPIDVTDTSSIPQEEKEPPPTDASTTPEIRTEVGEKEGAAEE